MIHGKIKKSCAPVAQRIERWPPEPNAAVRVCPGVLFLLTRSLINKNYRIGMKFSIDVLFLMVSKREKLIYIKNYYHSGPWM